MNSEQLLVLTAAVTVRGTPQTEIRDQGQRLTQYLDSFRSWKEWTNTQGVDVLVVENTGFPLEAAARGRLCLDNWNFLSYRAGDDEHRAGKGVGEASILDKAAEWLASSGNNYRMIHKCTGRLFVRNIERLAKTYPANEDWISCRLTRDLTQVDSRYFNASSLFWQKRATGMGALVHEDKGIYLEHVLATRVLQAVANGSSRLGFSETPRILGLSGSTGQEYGWARAWLVDQMGKAAGRLVAQDYV